MKTHMVRATANAGITEKASYVPKQLLSVNMLKTLSFSAYLKKKCDIELSAVSVIAVKFRRNLTIFVNPSQGD